MSGSRPNQATRNVVAAKSQVSERRLRPVYDAIDCCNYKKALHEAERVLKKQQDFHTCEVLKALALVRLDRCDEASPILDAVIQEAPTDEATLQAMTIALKDLQQPEKICEMYANATKKEPNSEELLSHLFMAFVRVRNYKKQQETAMSLYKARPKNPYYFWAIMSLVLQATMGSDEKLAVNVSLPLAQRMIEKMIKEGKMEQEQETQLYLLVLELQQKYRDALNTLDSELGKKLDETTSFVNFVSSKGLDYFKKLCNWEQVNLLVKQMLKKEPDQWNVYQDYVSSVFHILDGNVKECKDGVDASLDDAVSFISTKKQENSKCRGPFLAHIELVSRSVARRQPNYADGHVCDLLIDYFERFGSKQVCACDLKLFLSTLEKKSIDKFFKEALLRVKFNSNNVPSDSNNVQKHVCWFEMQRLMGKHHSPFLNVEQRCQLLEKLCQLFEDCLPMVKDLTPREISPNDGYAVLAGHIFWDLWNETCDDKFFWRGVVFLSYVINLSPANYSVRFILIKFFNHIGAVGPSANVHSGLDLKQVQLDSLGYLISRHEQTCFHLDQAWSRSDATLAFFNGKNVTIDYIIAAYRYGSFDKIIEFTKFRDRLSMSQHYFSVLVEDRICKLTACAWNHDRTIGLISEFEVDPVKDFLLTTELSDNRDFKAMPSWEPSDRSLNDEQISESFVQEQNFLKFRSLVLRALTTCVYISEDIPIAATAVASAVSGSCGLTNGHTLLDKTTALSPILRCLIQDISDHLSKVSGEKIEVLSKWPSVQGPDVVTSLQVYLQNYHVHLLLVLLKLVVSVIQNDQDIIHLIKQAKEMVQKTAQVTKAKVNGHKSSLIHRDLVFESIMYSIESFGFGAILCGVCHSLFNKSSSSSQSANITSAANKQSSKRKKKGMQTTNTVAAVKEKTIDMTVITAEFNDLINDLKASLLDLEKDINDFKNTLSLDSLCSELDLKFSRIQLSELNPSQSGDKQTKSDLIRDLSMDSVQKDLQGQMASSYKHSFDQLEIVLKKKVFYLDHITSNTDTIFHM